MYNAFPSQPVLGRLKKSMIPEALRRNERVHVTKGKPELVHDPHCL
jgi:hypothetical protein